jgi:peptide-methionine (R)-S-oxide reductase
MKPVLMQFCMILATSALLGGSVALHAARQDSPAASKQQAGDSLRAADGKTDGGNNAAAGKTDGGNSTPATDPAGTDAAGKDAAAKYVDSKADQKSKARAKPEPEFVQKTDAEWRKILTKSQYMVTRHKATEPAFSGKYATGHFRGMFLCVCCDAEVFSAQSKFDSGTGWPSFDRPANARAVVRAMDYDAFEPRIEVMCRRCGAHLGHVFDDGPTATGLRFCLNSTALKLRPPEGETESTKSTTSRTTSRSSSKARAKMKSKSATMTRLKAKTKTEQPSSDSQESPASPAGETATPKTAAPSQKPSPKPSA